MTKLKIRVTKEILERSKDCKPENVYTGCAIVYAIEDVFPTAIVSSANIFINLETKIPLPFEAREFIRAFDVSSIQQRLEMDELEFEVEIPDEIIDRINIDEIKKLLVSHPTLELVN